MSILENITLLKQSKEKLRIGLGLDASVPFNEYVNNIAYNPIELFKDSKQGVWYDPSDKSTLFQDVAGTVPVTKDGDPVALMRDKSGNGNHATQTVSTSRPIYKTDGVLHWLVFDGVDDFMVFNRAVNISKGHFLASIQSLNTAKSALLSGAAAGYITANPILGHNKAATDGFIDTPSMYSLSKVKTFSFEYVNEYPVVTDSTGTVYTSSLVRRIYGQEAINILGAYSTAGSIAFKGSIYGIALLENTTSPVTNQLALDYLASKSGVTL